MSKCAFCDRSEISDRLFYEDSQWLGFLAAPFHVRGHAILAAKKRNRKCPAELNEAVLKGLGLATARVVRVLKEHYSIKDVIKDVLIVSVRGDIKHCHFHLIPLYEKDEKTWRKERLYEKGHLAEYLGYLEKNGDERATRKRIDKGWDRQKQREEITKNLSKQVSALRKRCKGNLLKRA